jgi:hypothetical protein
VGNTGTTIVTVETPGRVTYVVEYQVVNTEFETVAVSVAVETEVRTTVWVE